MEYHKILKQHEQDTFIKSGESYKEILIKGFKEDRAFHKITNSFSTDLNKKVNELFPKSNKEILYLLNVYKKRADNYSKNDTENILKNELLKEYNNSSVKDKFTYEELVIKLGAYEGFTKAYSTISNHTNFYSLLYKKNEFEKFIFTYDFNKINKKKTNLLNKYYPNRAGSIIDFDDYSLKSNEKNINKRVNDTIELFGVNFNLNEFALYNREWKNFNVHNGVSYKNIYDKVMLDFNDPYNYIKKNRKYDGTPFYKALQEDKPTDKKNFKVELAYTKIINLAKRASNEKFLKYSEERKILFQN